MIPADLKNPFLVHKVDDIVTLPPGDVPDLHQDVLAKAMAATRQTRQTGQSIGLLVTGEAGSGKSHLIAQLRQPLAESPEAALVGVPLRGAYAGRLWRHLRERLVTELLCEDSKRSRGTSLLVRILRNRFPGWRGFSQAEPGGLISVLVGRPSPDNDLHSYLDRFARTTAFDYHLQKVLPTLGNTTLASLAMNWLTIPA